MYEHIKYYQVYYMILLSLLSFITIKINGETAIVVLSVKL